MIVRSAADYRIMPWANGLGQTTELLREDGPDGLHLRLSIATVTQDGPFSVFPAIDRVLTVICGPGFYLAGSGLQLHAAPFNPVAFPGDVAIAATGVFAASEDFNVFTARALPAPRVWLVGSGVIVPTGRLFLLPLQPATANSTALGARDLLETRNPVTLGAHGPVIAVELPA